MCRLGDVVIGLSARQQNGAVANGGLSPRLTYFSISHWGMFEFVPWRPFQVPAGFKFTDHDIAEWSKPNGWIEIIPNERRAAK